MLVVFDLDDTLACTKARRHFIIPPGKEYAQYTADQKAEADASGFRPDWDAFFQARHTDQPIWPTIELLMTLSMAGHEVEIWTAAREDSRLVAEVWLEEHNIPSTYLTRMRQVGDFRPTIELKESWLRESKPHMWFDDHLGVIDMVRKHGVIGCAVGDNNY